MRGKQNKFIFTDRSSITWCEVVLIVTAAIFVLGFVQGILM